MTMTAKEPSAATSDVGLGRARQTAIFRAGALGRAPSIPTDARTLERRAKRAMSPTAWVYVAGGAGEGRTMRHNLEAFERLRIVPRMLRGVPQRDLATSIVGTPLSSPVLLAPIGAGVGGGSQQRRDHCSRGRGSWHRVRDLLSGL